VKIRPLLALTVTAVALTIASPAPAAPPAKVLTFADSGKTVSLARGQALRIRLEVCGGCGYHWETRTAPDTQVLRRQSQQQEKSDDCEPPCVGGSTFTIFRYVGRASGRTTLRLGYIPPGSSKPSKSFRLTVRVR
jgi:predicted secreted protein